MEWLLDIVLVLLLTLTLIHALRLERALGVLQRDRTALEELIGRFNASTRQAEHGVEQLREAAEGAGRQIARQMEAGATLKDDLVFLVERGERLADRLDGVVRAARPFARDADRTGRESAGSNEDRPSRESGGVTRRREPASFADSQAVSRQWDEPGWREPPGSDQAAKIVAQSEAARTASPGLAQPAPRVRSQAERDLLNALRAVR